MANMNGIQMFSAAASLCAAGLTYYGLRQAAPSIPKLTFGRSLEKDPTVKTTHIQQMDRLIPIIAAGVGLGCAYFTGLISPRILALHSRAWYNGTIIVAAGFNEEGRLSWIERIGNRTFFSVD